MEATCSSMYCTSARQFSLSWEQLCRVIAKQRGEDTHDSFRAVVVVYAVADQILKNLRRIGARVVWLIKLADVAAAGNVYSAKVGQNSRKALIAIASTRRSASVCASITYDPSVVALPPLSFTPNAPPRVTS